MGAFFIAKRDRPDEPAPVLNRLQRHFERRGFPESLRVSTGEYDIGLYKKRHVANSNSYFENEKDFCLSTGTILYRKNHGEEALRRFHADFICGSVSWEDAYGNFSLIVCAARRLYLITDRLGIYPVWHAADWSVISSSFLAVVEAQDRTTINPQSVYEYVFQGTSYGNETPFHEVRRLDHGRGFALDGRGGSSEILPPIPRLELERDLNVSLEKNVSNLRRYFDAIATCFGDKVDTALSGGYDSRLTLCLLLESGVSPKIHVYGSDEDIDVRVAKTIAGSEGFVLHHIDKNLSPKMDPDRIENITARNFAAFDGFPTDGIIDDGIDLETRSDRCATGELMLNGGGGEVFRNFFYLPRRSFSVRQFLWTFYSQFDPSVCTDAFSQHAYYRALGEKVKRTTGITGEQLDRNDIEFLYPAFRCRFWMGKNNGVNNTLGWSLTPFIDANITPDAGAIDLRHKNCGRFEAAIIRHINPRLAAYGSAYGHDFSGDPPLKRIAKDLTTLWRPPLLRRYTYRLRRRSRADWPYYFDDAYISRVLDTAFPYLRKFFHIPKIVDSAQYQRICTLEYLFERFQPTDHGT